MRSERIETTVLVSSKAYASLIHVFLISFGIMMLFQDYISDKFKGSETIYQVIKYADEGFLISIFIFAWLVRISTSHPYRRMNIDLLLYLFMGFAILNSIIKHVPFTVYSAQLLLYLKGFFIFYICAQSRMNRGFVKNYIAVFFGIGIFVFIFGLIDFMTPLAFRTAIGNRTFIEYRNGLPSVISFFSHPAVFAWYMSFLSLFCFAFFFELRRIRYLVSGMLFMVACLLAQRAKSIIGLAIAVVIGFLFKPSKHYFKTGSILLIGIALVFVAFLPTLIDLVNTKIQLYIVGENANEIARNVLYVKSVEIAGDQFPFGAGLGRYGSWISRINYSPVYEQYGLSKIYGMSKAFPLFINDTFWPMVIGETGWIGLWLYMLIIASLVIALYRFIKKTDDKRDNAFQLGTLLILLESLIESIAQPVYVSPPANYFIFGSVGLCYALYRNHTQKSDTTEIQKGGEHSG